MDPFMQLLAEFAGRAAAAGRVRAYTVLLTVAGVLLIAAATLLDAVPALPVLLGCAAGIAWFSVGYLVVHHLLPATRRRRLDLRGNWELPARRRLVIWSLLGWMIAVAVVSRWLLAVPALLGALNVAVLLMLFRIASASPAERAVLDAAMADEEAWYDPAEFTDGDADDFTNETANDFADDFTDEVVDDFIDDVDPRG